MGQETVSLLFSGASSPTYLFLHVFFLFFCLIAFLRRVALCPSHGSVHVLVSICNRSLSYDAVVLKSWFVQKKTPEDCVDHHEFFHTHTHDTYVCSDGDSIINPVSCLVSALPSDLKGVESSMIDSHDELPPATDYLR